MSKTENRKIGNRAIVAWLLSTGVIVACVAFVIGRKWPIETITNLFASADATVASPPWSTFARSDLQRYEMMRVQVGSKVYIFSGFYTPDTKATARVESLDLLTGKWARLADMPVAVTHATPVNVRDTVWIAGGFEGDHPGPATARVWRYAITSDSWSEGPPLPAPRGSGALVAAGDTLHYFGGFLSDRDSNSADHWRLVIGESTWKSAAPFPSPRGHMSAMRVGNQLYAFGGSDRHDPRPVDVALVDRFEMHRGLWSAAPSLPAAVSHTEPATMLYGADVVIVGGRSKPTMRENTDDVLLFESGIERWTHLGHAPMPMLGGFAAILGDTLYAGLGAAEGNLPVNLEVWRRPLRNIWWAGTSMPVALGEVSAGILGNKLYVVGQGARVTLEYDIAGGLWHTVPSGGRPAIGNHHAAEVVNGKWMLFGGLGGASEGIVQVFDPLTGVWVLGPRMPFAAGASASAAIANRVYVAGGIVENRTTASTAMFDTETQQWSTVAPMPRPRNHAASATDGSKLYVFGGRGPGSGDSNVVANGFDDVQIYDPINNRWTVSDGGALSPKPMPFPRGGMGKAIYLDGEFWVIGGETESGVGATPQKTFARVDIFNPVRNEWRVGPPLNTARHGIFPVLHDGRVFVAGGGVMAGHSSSAILEVLWPRTR